MPLPGSDSVDDFGGGLVDYDGIAVIDPETDRGAAGVNRMVADVSGMTHTIDRAWCQMTLNGSATPALVAYDTVWGNNPATAAAPVLARSTTGVYTMTLPLEVPDLLDSETISGLATPGYVGPTPLLLRDGKGQIANGTTPYIVQVVITAANVATIYVFNPTTGALTDPSGATTCSVWVI
jgi:hypothetical protein